jgi:hypothetical protein
MCAEDISHRAAESRKRSKEIRLMGPMTTYIVRILSEKWRKSNGDTQLISRNNSHTTLSRMFNRLFTLVHHFSRVSFLVYEQVSIPKYVLLQAVEFGPGKWEVTFTAEDCNWPQSRAVHTFQIRRVLSLLNISRHPFYSQTLKFFPSQWAQDLVISI